MNKLLLLGAAALVDGGKVTAMLPASMDKAHQAKLDKLSKLEGKDFVKEYESMHVPGSREVSFGNRSEAAPRAVGGTRFFLGAPA